MSRILVFLLALASLSIMAMTELHLWCSPGKLLFDVLFRCDMGCLGLSGAIGLFL